jgi:N-acyl-D-amino-acid deacylase
VFGLADRGILAPGRCADLVVFDPETAAGRATFEAPIASSAGIEPVVVNGAVTWHHGRHTGDRAGRVLRRDPALRETAP